MEAIERAKQANFSRNAGGEEYMLQRSLIGTPTTIQEKIEAYTTVGIQEFILYFPQPKRMKSINLFAAAIMHAT